VIKSHEEGFWDGQDLVRRPAQCGAAEERPRRSLRKSLLMSPSHQLFHRRYFSHAACSGNMHFHLLSDVNRAVERSVVRGRKHSETYAAFFGQTCSKTKHTYGDYRYVCLHK